MRISAPVWEGTWRVDEDVSRTVEFDRYGIAAASIGMRGPYHRCIQKAEQMRVHPDYPWLFRKAATVAREEANYGKFVVDYEGMPPETDKRVYSLKAALNSEPVATHPDFVEFGTSANGVLFDADGKFQGFEATVDGEPNPFGGIESWLVPTMIYTEKWVRGRSFRESRDAEMVGRIDPNPPDSDAKPRASGRNYLLLGMDIELVGDGSVMTRQWKMSGPRKWNSTIYK